MLRRLYFISAVLLVGSFAGASCLDTSEAVISSTTTFGTCVSKERLELRTKQLYCGETLLDEWTYWAGRFEQVETTVAKVLKQVTNTCANTVVSSQTITRKTTNIGGYYISDMGSVYPLASNWYVTRHSDGVDTIQVGEDCDNFTMQSGNERRSEHREPLAEDEAIREMADEKSGCESNRN